MVIILMGVTGAGKTTIGRLLAQELDWKFIDADDFHPSANVEKMRKGIPLTDADREPWLQALHNLIVKAIASQTSLVLACSALKQKYRERLQVAPEVKLVYLRGTRAVITARLTDRQGHFATSTLLAGQFADLEEPARAVMVDISRAPEQIVAMVRENLGLLQKS